MTSVITRFFCFLLYLNSNFLLHELDENSDQKNPNFEKSLVCKNGLGGHEELANDAYNRQKGVKFSLNHAQFIYTSSCQLSKCPTTSLFDSTIFNFHARTRFWVVY